MIKVKAIFKGKDGSCGYKTNCEYTLEIYHENNQYIQISKVNDVGGYCDYGSMISFLSNWDNIRKV